MRDEERRRRDESSDAESLDRRGSPVAETPEPPEAEALWKKLADEQTGEGERYAAAVALAQFGQTFRTEAAAVLRELIGTPQSAHRWEAVESLARLGPKYREQAATALRRMIDDTRADIADRRTAAVILGNLGGAAFQAESSAALRHVDPNGGIHGDPREAAVQALAGRKLGRQGKARALRNVIDDPHADLAHRRMAAILLAQLAPEYEAPAAASLKQMADDPRAAADDRGEAIIALARLHLYGQGVDDALRGVIVAAGADLRCQAAELLAAQGREYREESAAALREVIVEAGTDPIARRRAAQGLALLSEEHLDEAVAVLLEMIAGDAAERREAIESISSLGHEGRTYEDMGAEVVGRGHRARSAKILHRLLADAAVSDADRRNAALAVYGLGAGYRDLVAEALTRVLLDKGLEAGVPQETAGWLGSVGPQHHELAVAVLRTAMVDQRAPASIRRKAAEALAALEGSSGAAHLEAAAGSLSSMLLDQSLDPAERREAARSMAHLITLMDGALYSYPALLAAIVDPSTDSAGRRWAVEALVEVRGYRKDVADALRTVIQNTAVDDADRQAASEFLADLALQPQSDHDQEPAGPPLGLVGRLRRSLGRR